MPLCFFCLVTKLKNSQTGYLKHLKSHNWRGFGLSLSRLFDFVQFAQPFLINSIDLVLHQRLRKSLLELEEAPALAAGVIATI